MRDSQIKWYLQKSLPVSGGGGVVVEEGEHVELERVVLLPGQGDNDDDYHDDQGEHLSINISFYSLVGEMMLIIMMVRANMLSINILFLSMFLGTSSSLVKELFSFWILGNEISLFLQRSYYSKETICHVL